MVAGEIAGAVELLAALKRAGVPCYALTNMEAETYPLRREPIRVHAAGSTAPSSRLTRAWQNPTRRSSVACCAASDYVRERTVMVDDSVPNLDAARSVGMQAVHFRCAAELRRWLVAAGLLGPDGAGVRPS